MPDREKYIEVLSKTAKAVKELNEDAPIKISLECVEDILELLKEQEPIPCGEKIKAGDVILDFYECGYCKNAIRKPWKYCPFCGQAVKWE